MQITIIDILPMKITNSDTGTDSSIMYLSYLNIKMLQEKFLFAVMT